MVVEVGDLILAGCGTPLKFIGLTKLDKDGDAPIVYKHPLFHKHARMCPPCDRKLNNYLGSIIEQDRAGPPECVT